MKPLDHALFVATPISPGRAARTSRFDARAIKLLDNPLLDIFISPLRSARVPRFDARVS